MSLHFIRHGESVSNEQNLFAGRFDTPLTTLGYRQAQQARKRIEAAGLTFDEVHVSPLIRARETAATVVAGIGEIKTVITDDLIERDFGKLSEQNKSLIKKHYGASDFEHMFHSAEGAPPQGESFVEMYNRVKRYYDETLKPRSDSGRKILVVSHKYTIEMFVLIAADLSPTAYHDFKIPNSKPCSLDDLRKAVRQTSAELNTISEEIEAGLSRYILIAIAAAALLRFATGAALPTCAYTVLMSSLLGFNAFTSFLRLGAKVVQSAPMSFKKIWKGGLIKALIGVILVLTAKTSFATSLGLFLLLPSAMTAPTFSLMWGGDYFLSVQATLVLTILSPIVLALLASLGGLEWHIHLKGFFLLLSVSVMFPGVLAQVWRRQKPIDAGALSTNWGWLGGASMIPLAALSAYQLLPAFSHLSLEGGSVGWIRSFLAAMTLLLSIKVFGLIAAKLSKGNSRIRRDLYITHVVPNIFLWFELLPNTQEFAKLKVLTVAGFFVSIYLEEKRFVAQFAKLMKDPCISKSTKEYRSSSSRALCLRSSNRGPIRHLN